MQFRGTQRIGERTHWSLTRTGFSRRMWMSWDRLTCSIFRFQLDDGSVPEGKLLCAALHWRWQLLSMPLIGKRFQGTSFLLSKQQEGWTAAPSTHWPCEHCRVPMSPCTTNVLCHQWRWSVNESLSFLVWSEQLSNRRDSFTHWSTTQIESTRKKKKTNAKLLQWVIHARILEINKCTDKCLKRRCFNFRGYTICKAFPVGENLEFSKMFFETCAMSGESLNNDTTLRWELCVFQQFMASAVAC